MDCLDGKRKGDKGWWGNKGRTDCLDGKRKSKIRDGGGNEERTDGLLGWKEEEGDKGWWGERGKD